MMASQWPALPSDRVPTGARHEVAVDELFFSTTDERGVITEANSVFVRLSRFSRPQLMGAPHNIIRHPVMPQGAFKLMWDTLEAGEPFCAYVDNLAADGSAYTVFATITPIADGYLSVRSSPMVDELRSAAFSLYAPACSVELRARAEGVPSRQAAQIGLDNLAKGLANAGFPSYDEFVWTALPAEVSSRCAAATPLWQRSDTTPELSHMLASAIDLAGELRSWDGRQRDLAHVAQRLNDAMPQLRQATNDTNAAAADISGSASQDPKLAPIMLSLTLWAAMTSEIDQAVSELIEELARLRTNSAKTRFRIALARLHTDAVGQFVNELIDGVDPDMWGEDAIDMLCGALADGFVHARRLTTENAGLAAHVIELIDTVAGLMALPRDLIANWTTMVQGRDDHAVIALIPKVTQQLDHTQASLDLLSRLAKDCQAVALAQDTSLAEHYLGAIEEAVARYVTPAASPRRGT